jgi:uracil-DNA glycosylase family 4
VTPIPPDTSRAYARVLVRAERDFGISSICLPGSMRTDSSAEASAAPTDDAPSASSDGEKAQALAALRARHDRECPHCTTATAHSQTVFGEGSPDAEVMFVGEAPGEQEDRTGRPFVGRAGQKLEDMIKAMGLSREAVYIANVLKSRPPDNRTPLRHEVEACGPYLVEQVRIIRPRAIVALGGPATKLLLETEEGITRLRGIWATYRAGDLEIPVMPTFHPAYLLRNYTPEVRKQVWSDLTQVLERLGRGRG